MLLEDIIIKFSLFSFTKNTKYLSFWCESSFVWLTKSLIDEEQFISSCSFCYFSHSSCINSNSYGSNSRSCNIPLHLTLTLYLHTFTFVQYCSSYLVFITGAKCNTVVAIFICHHLIPFESLTSEIGVAHWAGYFYTQHTICSTFYSLSNCPEYIPKFQLWLD